jgi:hypothetical protein
MVEGPGCTRNGNRARTLVGMQVCGIGKAPRKKQASPGSGASRSNADGVNCGGVAAFKSDAVDVASSARGRTLVAVLTLGKEVSCPHWSHCCRRSFCLDFTTNNRAPSIVVCVSVWLSWCSCLGVHECECVSGQGERVNSRLLIRFTICLSHFLQLTT